MNRRHVPSARTATSGRIKRLAAAGALALASATGALVLASPAHALGAGQVCMFNAPSGAQGAGHVGWGFLIGGSSTWTYGATEQTNHSWHASGSWSAMLSAFKYNSSSKYLYYECSHSPNSSVGAANNQVTAGENSGYNLATDNCLTKAVAIYKAYDGGTYGGMYWGGSEGPNWYFDHLPGAFGFSSRQYL
jgi:hypothetical protein